MELFIYTAISKQLGKMKHLQLQKISKISSQAICWKLFQSKPTETFWWPKKPTPLPSAFEVLNIFMPLRQNFSDFLKQDVDSKNPTPFLP